MNAWNNIKAVTKRELLGYFNSPVAYIFIVIFLLVAPGFAFQMGQFFERGQADLQPFFVWHPWLFLVLAPAVGMRLWADEQRVGTLELLMTMPIQPWHAIVGKFLASWLVLIIALLLTFPLVITVNYLGDPDNGVILLGYIGSILLSGAFLAVTCATSAMTRNQVVAFILSLVVCLFLTLAGFPPVTRALQQVAPDLPGLVDAVAAMSAWTHYDNFQRGVLDSRDLLYFFSVIGFFLFLTSVILRGHRS
jgi:ABC-2 type transport system permease protein